MNTETPRAVMAPTSAQSEAIHTNHSNVLCVAGPGSGKSTTVIARIKRLVENAVDPATIAALSFTNAASRILNERLGEIQLGANSTLHSFALRCLKKHGGRYGYGERTAIISPESAADLMASKAQSLGCKTAISTLLKAKAELGRPARGQRLTLDQTVIATYLDELKEAKVVDYDVLLQEFRDMLTSGSPNAMSAQQSIYQEFSYLFVDEVQDSAPIDWEIYRALSIPNKFYTGDPDQNLFEFRGARVREMVEEAEKSETLVIKLEQNFRSDLAICDVAQRLIENNKNRVPKKTISVRGAGGSVEYIGDFNNEGDEISAVTNRIKALTVKLGEVAILARTNAIAEGFRKALPALNIPVVEKKTYSLPRDWAYARSLIEVLISPNNDSLAYFYLVARGLNKGMPPAAARKAAQAIRVDSNSMGKTVNQNLLHMEPITRPESALAALVGAGVSREAHMIAVEKWRELPPGATMEEFTLALAETKDYVKEAGGEGVHVSTIHGWKGREADVVFLVGCEDEVFPGREAKEGDEGIEASRRCLYVGVTRARTSLILSSAKTRITEWKQVVSRTPSRFLKEVA